MAYSDMIDVAVFIEEELSKSGQLHGYCWMYQKCIQSGFIFRKEDIRHILSILDPKGVALRQQRHLKRRTYNSKGQNFLWHLDSYDKLKPFGICINGCIDGFSQKLMWLEAHTTNSNPRIIAG